MGTLAVDVLIFVKKRIVQVGEPFGLGSSEHRVMNMKSKEI